MTDNITDQPDGATPLEDISGLLRDEITTRKQLNAAETLNILSAEDWIEGGHLGDVFTVEFYKKLHNRMYGEVWEWAGSLCSVTEARSNIGVAPEMVPMELGRVAMNYHEEWEAHDQENLIPFIASYHHALVRVHPFNNGNGRWSRLACDVVIKRLTNVKPIIWASDTLNVDSDERKHYIAVNFPRNGRHERSNLRISESRSLCLEQETHTQRSFVAMPSNYYAPADDR